MKQWGLAVVSIGGVIIISSQTQSNPLPLLVAGLSFVVLGIFLYKKGKREQK